MKRADGAGRTGRPDRKDRRRRSGRTNRAGPAGRPAGPGLWAGAFHHQLNELYGVATRPPAVHLVAFDVLNSRLSRDGLTRDEVLEDLRAGLYNVAPLEERSGDRRRYRVVTRRLEVRLHVEASRRQGSPPLTVLDGARRRNAPPAAWHSPLVPSEVTLRDPGNAARCDLDELAERVNGARRLAEAEQALTTVRLTPRRHAQLRHEVMTRYGTLKALILLAKQRADAGDTASVEGAVVDGTSAFPPGHPLAAELVVRLDRPSPFAEDDGVELSVWPVGDPRSAERLRVGGVVDDALALLLPDRAPATARIRRRLPHGTRVVVSEAGDFRYQRHLHALQKFLNEEISGNWTALATLLARPASLVAPGRLPEVLPARRQVNVEQRKAVAAALATPYACFVQGPPGTGKTQVIADVVSRLAARGERVLLTAPTHVALDEVVRRLTDEPGVLPLRLSWKDTLVADDVQQFTKSAYDNVLAARVRTPGTSRLAEWHDRHRRATAERQALAAWGRAVDERTAATAERAAAREAFEQGRRHSNAERHRLASRLAHAQAKADAHGQAVAALRAEDVRLADLIAVLEPARGAVGRLLDRIGVGRIGRLRTARTALQPRLADANQAFHEAGRAYAAESRNHDAGVARLAEANDAAEARVTAAEDRWSEAQARLDKATAALAPAGVPEPPVAPGALEARVAELDGECQTLAARIDVQRRWFELLGMAGRDEDDDRRRGREVVGRALRSAVNLVCSTTTGFGGDQDYRDLDYDTLIVDEASKVTSAEFLIPAIRARRWILVGDEKQLPPHVQPRDEHHIHAMAALHLTERQPEHTLASAIDHLASVWRAQDDEDLHMFRTTSVEDVATRLLDGGTWANAHRKLYAGQLDRVRADGDTAEDRVLRAMRDHLVTSLFERCVAEAPALAHRLVEQRRMPAEIAELVRVPVYGGRYVSPDPTVDPDASRPLTSPSFPTPVVFLDTSSQPDPWATQEGTSVVNPLEAAWAVEVCRRWEHDLGALGHAGRTSISVLAFYGAQARLIRHGLGYPAYRDFSLLDFQVVDAVDRIQGQQSDIVVVSFCRTHRSRPNVELREGFARWLQSINRLNVACTRARRSLVLIGHRATLRRLRGVAPAEAFYANLFNLTGGVTFRDDWATTARRRGREQKRGRR